MFLDSSTYLASRSCAMRSPPRVSTAPSKTVSEGWGKYKALASTLLLTMFELIDKRPHRSTYGGLGTPASYRRHGS